MESEVLVLVVVLLVFLVLLTVTVVVLVVVVVFWVVSLPFAHFGQAVWPRPMAVASDTRWAFVMPWQVRSL